MDGGESLAFCSCISNGYQHLSVSQYHADTRYTVLEDRSLRETDAYPSTSRHH